MPCSDAPGLRAGLGHGVFMGAGQTRKVPKAGHPTKGCLGRQVDRKSHVARRTVGAVGVDALDTAKSAVLGNGLHGFSSCRLGPHYLHSARSCPAWLSLVWGRGPGMAVLWPRGAVLQVSRPAFDRPRPGPYGRQSPSALTVRRAPSHSTAGAGAPLPSWMGLVVDVHQSLLVDGCVDLRRA